MATAFENILVGFKRDERGAVAIIFALTAIVMLMICGLAIDVGRAVHANTKMRAAIDAAALAAARGVRLHGLSAAQATALAQKMFTENFSSGSAGFATVKSVNVIVDVSKAQVEVKVDAEVPTTLGQLAGITALPIPKSSVAIFDAKDIEVAVQLDVTGSMGGTKIADLKDATKSLVDILIPASGTGAQKVRIGFAPFAAGVNAGPYASTMNGGAGAGQTCVYERKSSGYQNSDNYPAGAAALKTKMDLPGAAGCSGAQLLPMTDDRALLKSTVDGYSTGGTTAGHLGTAFSWYLLSPSWASVWPSSARPANYNDGKTIKVAILMTDGEYNTVGGKGSSSSAQIARDTCAAMKAKGITVYTVGFKLISGAQSEQTMQLCASSPAHAYSANNGAALKKAFKDIAESITTLRLSK
ncbi:MAG: VWA domain-containing protein [Hyphomicrobiaceae bacterium]|nr:VWA domain-containing protein [Hyphomicrobiaceae bacterium]